MIQSKLLCQRELFSPAKLKEKENSAFAPEIKLKAAELLLREDRLKVEKESPSN